ncbi:MAG: hypothetical protein RL594_1201 [Bacteroidota bacterium]|jgi:hypothetical protein
MKRFVVVPILLTTLLAGALTAAETPTWSSDVARIIYANCTSCHRSGEIAPFPLETYEQVADFGYSIHRAVTKREMPPWPPAKGHGNFIGNRSLSDADIATIKAWVDGGMPVGDLSTAPPPPVFPTGSQLGTPDLVLTMNQKWTIEGNSKDVYRYFVLPTNLLEDRRVKAIEFRPGNASVVHHVLYFLDTTGTARRKDAEDPKPGYSGFGDPGFETAVSFLGWVPGAQTRFYPPTIGSTMYKNSDLVIQVHYAPSSTEQTDQSHVNVFFHSADEVRQVQEFAMSPRNLPSGQRFIIPANRVQAFKTTFTIPLEISLIGIAPHMHLLGKDCRSYAITPMGDTIRLINLPVWDFHWQGGYTYKNPVRIPRGSILVYEASYDNTLNNLNNPNNPPKQVTWGEATTDEMLLCYFHWLPYQPGDETLDMETRLPTSVREISTGAPFHIEAWPNVTSGSIQLAVESNLERTITVDILDAQGSKVHRSTNLHTIPQGMSSLVVPMSELASGVYTVRASSGDNTSICRVVVKR